MNDKEKELYNLRRPDPNNFNYYFDKITSRFIKSRQNEIGYPNKVLFIRNDNIGDMVQSTQAFRELKKVFPNVKISVLATKINKSIIEKDDNIDNIIEIDLFWRRGFKGFLDYLKVLRKIRKEKFDVGIDMRKSKLNIFFFLFIPKIKNRISYYNVNGGKAFLTHPIIYPSKIRDIQEDIGIINKAFNLNITNYWPHIITDKEDENSIKEFLETNKLKKYIVISPGATAESKKWSEEKFDELIKRFHKKYLNYKIIVTGGPSDSEIIKKLCNNNPNITLPLIGFNLRKLSIILRRAEAVIAHDGGVASITWVSDGKLIQLNAGVDLDMLGPPKNSLVISHKLDCYPCNWSKPCKKPCGVWCMDLISVDEVMDAIKKTFSKE